MTQQELDWSKLPESLRYLAEPAERFGIHQFEDQIDEFIDKATSEEHAALREIAERFAPDIPAINDWLDRFCMTKHREAELVYFMMHLNGMVETYAPEKRTGAQ